MVSTFSFSENIRRKQIQSKTKAIKVYHKAMSLELLFENLHCKCLQGFTGKVHSVLVIMIGKNYTEGNHNKITGKIFNCYG